jgi:hypothetical protein
MIDKQFASFIHSFIKQYKTDIFNEMPKCKSLLLDLAKGEYKNEIRLLIQALDMGCYTTITNSSDLNITRMLLIKQLQEEYFISENIATSMIDMLLIELKNYKVEQIIQVTKTKPKKKITTQKNASNQNQSIQLPIGNTNNNAPIDISTIFKLSSEINSLISTKDNNEKLSFKDNNEKLSFERFNDRMKYVYEPAFKEYKEIMDKNGLNCEYHISPKGITFCFLFVKDVFHLYKNTPSPYYWIDKRKDDIVYTWADLGTDYNSFEKKHSIENLTKEIIINELTQFTEDVLSIIKNELNKRV